MKLRRNQKCPLHDSYYCCGRNEIIRRKPRPRPIFEGVTRVEDAFHPRGYRELRNRQAMKKLLNQKIEEQKGFCAICSEKFDDYRQIVPDHKEPRGMGGARRDDHPDNIQAVHQYPCNVSKGSKRA